MARGNSRALSEIGPNSILDVDVFDDRYRGSPRDHEQRYYFDQLNADIQLPAVTQANVEASMKLAELRKEEALKPDDKDFVKNQRIKAAKEAYDVALGKTLESAFGSVENANLVAVMLGKRDINELLTPLDQYGNKKVDGIFYKGNGNFAEYVVNEIKYAKGLDYEGSATAFIEENLKKIMGEFSASVTGRRYASLSYENDGSKEIRSNKDFKREGSAAQFRVEAAEYVKKAGGKYSPPDISPEEYKSSTKYNTDKIESIRMGQRALLTQFRADGYGSDKQRAKLVERLKSAWNKDTMSLDMSDKERTSIFNAIKRTQGKGSLDRLNAYSDSLTPNQRANFIYDLKRPDRGGY